MKRHALAVLALFISLILYFINLSALPFFESVYSLTKQVIQPLFELKGVLVDRTRHFFEVYVFLKDVSLENQRLKRQLQACALYKSQLHACESNLTALSNTINLSQNIKSYPILYAHVIAYDPSGNETFILIDRGQDAGIEEGMVVFHGSHLVGIVDKVYGGSSRVRTVFSGDFSISAVSGEKAYIYRGGYPYGSLLHVNLEDPIREGDSVFLRVPGKYFPMLVIGTVHSVSQEGGSFFKSVKVKPFSDIRKLYFCIVIKEKL
ncbi:MAG: rod shape-determining protein MreC [Aquificaceae bacterium]|nr:rod shape-determining protein MreC [Aquificaceae bacterium]